MKSISEKASSFLPPPNTILTGGILCFYDLDNNILVIYKYELIMYKNVKYVQFKTFIQNYQKLIIIFLGFLR